MASIDDLFKVRFALSSDCSDARLTVKQKPGAPSNKRKFEYTHDPSTQIYLSIMTIDS